MATPLSFIFGKSLFQTTNHPHFFSHLIINSSNPREKLKIQIKKEEGKSARVTIPKNPYPHPHPVIIRIITNTQQRGWGGSQLGMPQRLSVTWKVE